METIVFKNQDEDDPGKNVFKNFSHYFEINIFTKKNHFPSYP